ncbi:MAG: uroporphyrinogen decarboxylase family protein [Kiritimatiellae bacterium]|nr:uroporphyrinogen decarboxylase family protein [Kiritimatiellia bacterium]
MTKREVVRLALEHRTPPYVPWNCGFTQEAHARLVRHYGTSALDDRIHNHILTFGSSGEVFEPIGRGRVRDTFGVVWNRSVDKDIGIIEGCVLPSPSLRGFQFPDPRVPDVYTGISERIRAAPDRFRVFAVGFSLYERAWTLRGMENLYMDFLDHPGFVRELFETIADYNLGQIEEALKYDMDAVYFGDDWGQQHGLQMGPELWRSHIRPVLKRMYGAVRAAGKYVMIHSCGDVDEVFDDLVELGVNCFNPFQPEVMDVFALMRQYHGRLAFHGGLSTQRTLPYGSPDDVRRATRALLSAGRDGGYIFAPAHAVEGDVPLENMLAFIEELQQQPYAPR